MQVGTTSLAPMSSDLKPTQALTIELQGFINRIIAAQLNEFNMDSIPEEDRQFLVITTTEFVRDNIRKYLNGVKEHGPGFLTEVDHLNEAYKEVMDQLNYIKAAQYNKRIFDARYRGIKGEH